LTNSPFPCYNVCIVFIQEGEDTLKTRSDRPTLYATQVWSWIESGILEIKALKDTPIFHLTSGHTVRQKWLHKTQRGNITSESGTTYLRKGIFLVPIWKVVPDWQIKYYHDNNLPLAKQGIVFRGKTYQRLCYMQVDDIDHVLRQTIHTIEGYLAVSPLLAENYPDLMEKLYRQNQIIAHIGNRQIGAEGLAITICIRLKSISRSVKSISANAPAFSANASKSDKDTVALVFRRYANELAGMTFRPIFRQIGYASRSLTLAADHIQNDRLPRAQRCIASALKNLSDSIES